MSGGGISAPPGGEREDFPLPPGCDEGHVHTNGIQLHYVAAGAGPLVLLLHGFPEFWYSWRHQLPALAQRFRVVAPDLRGYNLSEKPPHGYDVTTLSADIRGLIGAFGEQRAHVVGHDWGGVIAWASAIRDPDVVNKLVILNSPHPALMLQEMRHPRQALRSTYMGFFQLRGVAERAIERDNYAMIWRTFRSADRARAFLTDEDIQRFARAIARPGALPAALAYYRQIMRSRSFQAISPLRVITAPTLVLWGEMDPYLGPDLLRGLDAWVSNLRVRRFPTAGHWLNQQEHERVNAALLDFLPA